MANLRCDLRLTVRNMLKSGFGAEDIAHKTGLQIAAVRQEIKFLRDNGTLAEMWPEIGA